MSRSGSYLLILIICILVSDYRANSEPDTRLSRRKRYVVFPEGSSFSIALCLTISTISRDDIFSEGVNWGIAYDLPNESKSFFEPFADSKLDYIKPASKYSSYANAPLNKNVVKFPEWNSNEKYYLKPGKWKYYKPDYYYLQRRHRRNLYDKLEVIMNAMNFDGRTCILRALCEASQRLMPKGNTLIEEMMRISFSFPLKRLFSFEPAEHHEYGKAHKAGHEGHNCAEKFPGCSFSLIDMALGRYDASRSRRPQLPVDSTRFTDPRIRYNMK